MQYIYISSYISIACLCQDWAVEGQIYFCVLFDCDFFAVFFEVHIVYCCIQYRQVVCFDPCAKWSIYILSNVVRIQVILFCYEDCIF